MNGEPGVAPRRQGLSAPEVEESRRAHGTNVLTPPLRTPWWRLYLEKLEDPVIRILLAAATLALAIGAVHGNFLEGIGIIIAIVLATALAFFNELKASREFDLLNRIDDDVPVQVIRDGAFRQVARKDLVVGDLVVIEAGEAVPADGKVLEGVSLLVNEASLTGESVPVSKAPEGASVTGRERAYPAESLLRGTTVVDGHGLYRVTAVGDRTEIGGVVRESQGDTSEVTPLQAQLAWLGKIVGVVGFGVAALTFLALIFRGALLGELTLSRSQWLVAGLLGAGALILTARVWLPILSDARELLSGRAETGSEGGAAFGWARSTLASAAIVGLGGWVSWSVGWIPAQPSQWLPTSAGEILLRYFMIAVTLIVVAVPEGLAMSVTLSLAYSMRRMTASNTLVRRIDACETIGAATVICSDKTGTLTRNEMRVEELRIARSPGGSLPPLFVEAVAANSTANLTREGEKARGLGSPTESALLLFLDSLGIDYEGVRGAFKVTGRITFSTERKLMGTFGGSAVDPSGRLHVKGAPELVLSRCREVFSGSGPELLTPGMRQAIEQDLRTFQERGMRTLGFAFKPIGDGEEADPEAAVHSMVWLGFAVLSDPLREEVPAAMKACREAGIRVKIVTGDTVETAQEVARQTGLLSAPHSSGTRMTGRELAELADTEAHAVAEELTVLARARPMDKLRLVKLLQDNGHVVAVTGDGTNDAPALHHANVGLAMGRSGTAIAKEASDIVLLDDSFHSIVTAVTWGRSLYLNIQRFILFQLTINVAALGIALLGPFLGTQMPLTVVQMLWVNLIMDTFAALALATEPPDPGVMRRPPRKPLEPIVSLAMARSIFGLGLLFVIGLAGLLLYLEGGDGLSRYELSIFFSVFVMLQFWNLGNARRLGSSESAFHKLRQNKMFLAIAATIFTGQILIVQFGGSLFRTAPLSLVHWVWIVSGTSLVLLGGEIWRFLERKSFLNSGSRMGSAFLNGGTE